MRALVTGASGFIGSTLIEELSTLGFDVQALMRRTSSAANLEGVKFERLEGDMSDYESLKRAVKNTDYVFHLAGALFAPNRAAYFKHNAEGTRLLAQAVAETRPNLSRFVFVSSMAAGGPSQTIQPRDETTACLPVSAYGESKLQAEQDLLKYRDVFPISIIRPPMVYGPRDTATLVFVQTVAKNLMPIFKSPSSDDGHKYYSTIHVKDLVRGIVQSGVASKDKVPSGEVFYLSDDRAVTYEQLMTVIAEKLEKDPLKIRLPQSALAVAANVLHVVGKITRKTYSMNLDKLNEVYPDYWTCSNAKAKRMLGFTTEFELSTGMTNTIEWYKRQKWI